MTIAFLIISVNFVVSVSMANSTEYELIISKSIDGAEPNSNVEFKIEVSPTPLVGAEEIHFVVETSDGSAEESKSDYTGISGMSITLNKLTPFVLIPVVVKDDIIVEGIEDFDLVIIAPPVFSPDFLYPDSLKPLSTDRATATITDDDNYSVSITPVTVTEGNPGDTVTADFVVSVGGSGTQDVTVDFSVAGSGANPATAGADFTVPVATSVTIVGGAGSETISIPVVSDDVVEANETFTVTLGAVSGPAVVTGGSAIGTITNDDNYSVSITPVTVTEGNPGDTVTADFVVSVGGSGTQDVTVDFSVAGSGANPATAGADFTVPVATSVTIVGGAGSETISIPVVSDDVVEANETFTVTLGAVSGPAVVTGGSAIGTITNDDNYSVSITPVTVTEGNPGDTVTADFVVSVGGSGTQDVTVDFSVAGSGANPATAGADFTVPVATSVTIVGGAGSETISIPVVSDDVVEANETFTVTLGAVSGPAVVTGGSAIGTITNDDNYSVSITPVTVTEGNPGDTVTADFVVSVGGSGTQDVTVDFSVAGSGANPATAGADFTVPVATSVTIVGGAGSETISIPVVSDDVVEANETFTVTLGAVSGPAVVTGGSAIGTITNDDNYSVSITPVTVTEGNPGDTVTADFVVSVGGSGTQDVTVDFSVAGSGANPATAGADFTVPVATSVTIVGGAGSETISIPVVSDDVVEANETFTVTLGAVSGPAVVTGGSAIGTITNDDASAVTISATDATAAEPSDNGQFTVTMSNPSASTTTVSCTVSGNASPGADYTALSGTVTIPANATTAIIDVTVINDAIVEGNETVTVALDSITAGAADITIGGTNSATVTIADNDATLTVYVVSPLGTSSASPSGTTSYDKGTVLALTPSPGTGELFSGWSGDLTGSDNPATIVIDANKTVTATFIRKTVTLTTQVVSLDGGGNILPDVGSYSYLWGDEVTVSANPDGNSVFAGWSGSLTGMANPATITMNGDQTVTANFELKKFSVTFNAGAHGLVQEGTNSPTNSITQQVKWNSNSTVVTAVANEHYHFLNWTNTAGSIVATAADLQALNVTQDMEFTANFEIDKFAVRFQSSNFGGIEVPTASPVYYEDEYIEYVDWGGSSKWVTASLADQSQFKGWSGDYTSSALTIQVTNVVDDMIVTYDTVPDINGCSTDVGKGYNGVFDENDFEMVNASVDTVTGHMKLDTGNQAIMPEKIVVPFTQDVYVTFLYEGAGYVSDFGWTLYEDAVDGSGNFLGWNNIPLSKKHVIYRNIQDDNETGGCCGGGNGILDTDSGLGGFPIANEANLAAYNDGTGIPFHVDLDGVVTPKDMKKKLGKFVGGTEIVFWITADRDWDTTDTSRVFFNKPWNPDHYDECVPPTGHAQWVDESNHIFDKIYHLGTPLVSETGCHIEGNWLATPVFNRMTTEFGVTLSGDYLLRITEDEPYPHVIVGAPPTDPNQWILGFEDLNADTGGSDMDHNDMVFHIERKTGGMARLESAAAIVPNEAEAYFTAVDFKVFDYLPGGSCLGKTSTTYFVSADDGAHWTEITAWDKVNESDSDKHILSSINPQNWTPGDPEYTYRTRRVDFLGLGLTGNKLVWKVELVSENQACVPEVVDVQLNADTASHGIFSRSSPVVQTNVIYGGTYITPASNWPVDERVNRGEVTASLIYTPEDPNTTLTGDQSLWKAGEVLAAMSPDERTIYFPNITVTQVVDEALLDAASSPLLGDGVTTTFSGTFAYHPVQATTIRIYDTRPEIFTDEHTDHLEGSLGGTGTIKRFTGEWQVTFNTAPAAGVPIKASYSYYTSSSTLQTFTDANVDNNMLALTNEFINPTGYIHDFDGDGNFDEDDADWLVQWVRGYKQPNTSTPKAWKLGPIDHSTPALMVPPGYPLWYFGSQVTKAERNKYKEFKDNWEERNSILFVGSRDGMLHAFDAGKYRYGDNPATVGIEENRGFFKWEEKPIPPPDYCTSYDPDCPNYGTGEELWAFIPANLIPRLKNNVLYGDDQAYVDASPALSDVYIDTNGDGDSDSWRTVILSAEGNGGDTVFCLDVTDPENPPTFMWEFAAPELFRSRSSPAVAQIGRIRDPNGTDAVKWVAFFVTGKVENSTLFPSIYMIDIADGSVVRKVVLDDPVDLDGSDTFRGHRISITAKAACPAASRPSSTRTRTGTSTVFTWQPIRG